MNNPIQVKRIEDFSGGMTNSRIAAFSIDETSFSTIKNMFYSEDGALEARGGLQDVITAFNASTIYVEAFSVWEDSSGIVWNVMIDNKDDLYISSTSSMTAAAKSTSVPDYSSQAAMADALYFADISHVTSKWDGSSLTTLTATVTGAGGEFPKAQQILTLHDRMFAMNVNVGGTTYSSRVYFSDAGDPELWQSTSWIDVQPDDGQQIRAAVSYRDEIIIFKDRSMYLLTGTDPDSFSLYRISDTYGVGADRSVNRTPSRSVAVGNKYLFWIDNDSQKIMVFDGASITVLPKQIPEADLIASGSYVQLMWFDDKLYVFNGGLATYVYDTKRNAWTILTFGAFFGFPYGGLIYLAGPAETGDVSRLHVCSFDPNDYRSDDLTTGGYMTVEAKSHYIPLADLGTNVRIRYIDFLLGTDVGTAIIQASLWTNYGRGGSVGFTIGTPDGEPRRFRLASPSDSFTEPSRNTESVAWQVYSGTGSAPISIRAIEIGFTVPPIRQRGNRGDTAEV